ncbi:MAG: hypothetical protein COB41_05575 [Proteobacteria bacterium]|nr:MAG: hypothetical protein COB41_05575 [Pseudomonadota bacterium]
MATSKKKKSKKVVGTSIYKKSRVTGEKPNKRLRARRTLNTKKGYYPNPLDTEYLIKIVTKTGDTGYFVSWFKVDTDQKKAMVFNGKNIVAAMVKSIKAFSHPAIKSVISKKKY